jgi:hypothetical protein
MSQATSTEASQETLYVPPTHILFRPHCTACVYCPNFVRRGDTICFQYARKPTEEMKVSYFILIFICGTLAIVADVERCPKNSQICT